MNLVIKDIIIWIFPKYLKQNYCQLVFEKYLSMNAYNPLTKSNGYQQSILTSVSETAEDFWISEAVSVKITTTVTGVIFYFYGSFIWRA